MAETKEKPAEENQELSRLDNLNKKQAEIIANNVDVIGKLTKENERLKAATGDARLVALQNALRPFSQLQITDNADDTSVIINRGVQITAKDIRDARKLVPR
jgi:hypothetical protein